MSTLDKSTPSAPRAREPYTLVAPITPSAPCRKVLIDGHVHVGYVKYVELEKIKVVVRVREDKQHAF